MSLRDATVAAVGDELYDDRASISVFDAALQGRVPDRLPPCRFDDVAADAERARFWHQRLVPLRGLRHEDELTRRYLTFETDLLGARDGLHWYDLQVTPYRMGKQLNQAHEIIRNLRFETAPDADAYLLLLDQYGVWIAGCDANLREQAARGIVLHEAAHRTGVRLLDGLDATLTQNLRVAPERLARLPQAALMRAAGGADVAIETRIRPALKKLRAYFTGDYAALVPPGEDAVGLGRYPGGQDAYALLVRHNTTLDMTPDAVHRAGLELVGELEARMASVRSRLGFSGTARRFLEHLLAEPPVKTSTPEEIETTYRAVLAQAEAIYPRLFGTRDYGRSDVKRLRPELEAGMTYGYYQPPLPYGDRAGYYVYNGSNPQERVSVVATALMLHETVPGHHVHFATQTLDESRPLVRRNPYLNAFAEAWAEYGAELGYEMGMYEDPYAEYGRLLMQMFLATRLVVDTGLNAFGWNLEKARSYMLERGPQSPAEAFSETVRYTCWPGQSLAYAIGPLRLRDARRAAEAKLGARFDLIGFHNAILDAGALPLDDVDFAIRHWVAQQQQG
ncbi:MAG: hypothetical protein JWM77_141 [Rhodospirillales bacterium]|nr:hypothetical protein [Rhodospirillales bacterium]